MTEDPLRELLRAKPYQQLGRIEQPFDLFAALQSALHENASSRALAFLFDSREHHGLGTRFADVFMDELQADRLVAQSSGICGGEALESLNFTGAMIRSHTEVTIGGLGRMDVLLEFLDAGCKVQGVLAIENKHFAAEQGDQVRRYQEALAGAYPGSHSCVLFLTPDGGDPQTASVGGQVRTGWAACSYEVVLQALTETERVAGAELEIFLKSLRRHLEQKLNIMTTNEADAEARDLVRALYQNERHRRAIDLICQHAPTGQELAKRVRAAFGKQVQERVSLEKSPRRGAQVLEAYYSLDDAYEVQLGDHKVGIDFMLYGAPQWAPGTTVSCGIVSWVKQASRDDRRALRLQYMGDESFKPGHPSEDWWWSSWLPWWAEGDHVLGALQEQDEAALVGLLVNAYKAFKGEIQPRLASPG